MAIVKTLPILLCLFEIILSDKCNSFNNVLIQIRTKDDRQLNHTSNNCIERKSFDPDTVVTEAYFYQQNIPIFGADSIRHLYQLKRVIIDNCSINQILPNAFRNNPNLEYVNVTNCKNLTTIRYWVFTEIPSLKVLHLDWNRIDRIENLSFSDLEFLQSVYITHNSLIEWQSDWFKNTTGLRLIDLRYNKIRSLPQRGFKNFKQLKRVYFDFNEIVSIEQHAFDGLNKLDYLGLKHNRLKQLHANIMPNKIEIKTFVLSANYLSFLSKDLLDKIKVNIVDIYYNPWKCTCLNSIINWTFINNVTIRSSQNCVNNGHVPICRATASSTDRCIETVEDDLMQKYFDEIRKIQPPIHGGCAQLS